MGAIRDQFRLSKLRLQDETASDFYLSCWQWNRMTLPMFCARLVLFLGCVAMVLSSMLLPERIIYIAYWPIYMTQWGLLMMTVTYGLATAVSAVAYYKGPIDSTFGLPWYIRLFWACYCIAVPLAFHITIFYYSFVMSTVDYEEYEVNAVLDAFTHGVNSIVMFVLLMTSNISVCIVQIVYPLLFMIVYMVFTIIYYYAGGTNPFGEVWIYPVLDWSQPWQAVATVAISATLLVSIFIVTVLLTLLRNQLTRRCRTTVFDVSN